MKFADGNLIMLPQLLITYEHWNVHHRKSTQHCQWVRYEIFPEMHCTWRSKCK